MNSANEQLARLLRAAAAAPSPAAVSLPFPAEARILAGWRRGESDSELVALIALFRRGLVCACGVATLIAAVSWLNHDTATNSLAMEEFALSADVINLAIAR